MLLVSFSTINSEATAASRGFKRIVVMSSQGFTQPVPIARVAEFVATPGVVAVTPFSWYGGKYNEEVMPFAQFAVDPSMFFTVYNEFVIPAGQVKDWQEDRTGCVIGRKTAVERKVKLGDPFPLKDGVYPFNLNLTVRGIFDGPANSDLRACYFHWDFLEEGLKKLGSKEAGNAGIVVLKCKDESQMPAICRKIDEAAINSDTPTRTQSEEAFGQMFAEMIGDFKWIIIFIGLAVGISLLCVTANAMAMALRERTTEVAVLKAIGFGKPLVVALVLAESILIAGIGGVIGAFGIKLLCDAVDLSKYSAGMLPFFYVPWSTAWGGFVVALGIGIFSGLFPAVQASRLSVVNGLRKVV
jgi:putative ABC transport system permease protein